MAVLEDLSEEEEYLLALLLDVSGIDIAEFLWVDETRPDSVFRCYDFQYTWYRCLDKHQIDQSGRSVGKSLGIQMRAYAFPFHSPGEEMLLTAPELIHLNPVTARVEERIMSTRISREMLNRSGGKSGFTHRPFEARFVNGANIVGRIPHKDGKGVKGMHPKQLEQDEAQDYPEPGWVELGETLKFGNPNAIWRAHGVSRGVPDRFKKQTDPNSGWTVHRLTGMHKPDWTPEERKAKAELYGSRDHPDYRRNILGLHGNAQSAIFVLSRLMAVVDTIESSHYNQYEYHNVRISDEMLRDSGTNIASLLELPGRHKMYDVAWAGMDVGLCVDEETEIFTRRGWLHWDQVTVGDESLAINPMTGRSEWQVITDLYRESRPEGWVMMEMQGQSFSAMTTPHHKWLVRHEGTGVWRWKLTSTLNTKDYIPLSVDRGDAPSTSTHEDEFVELVAWYVTEGMRQAKGQKAVCQSKTANPELTKRIRSCIRSLYGDPGSVKRGPYTPGDGPTWSERTRSIERGGVVGPGESSEVTYFYLSKPIADSLEEVAPGPEKVPTMDFLASLTERQLELFVEVCILGDGWTQGGRLYIEQHSEARIRAIEAACALAGKPTTTCYDRERGRWHLAIKTRSTVAPIKAASFPRKTDQAMTVRDVHYGGTIWCPTLKHSNWLARRRGSVYFTGNTNDPSEILVFGEHMPARSSKNPKPEPKLKLLTRINLQRISAPIHREVVDAICDHYRIKCFSFDGTGIGLPIWQEIQGGTSPHRKKIRSYNFSEKIFVGYEAEDEDRADEWDYEPEEIHALVLEYSTDMLRLLVDTSRIELPYDESLIREFAGQTYHVSKNNTNPYGRKIFSKGAYHALDAARMAVTGYYQHRVGALLQGRETTPVLDSFVMS